MDKYFNCHSHTYYSNLRLLDCINNPKELIDKAIELGMSGIAITDHECLSAHMEVNQYAQEIKKTHPDFKIALGNEIYLIDERHPGQKYYHFILIAKDLLGHRALRELSSIAWYNGYSDHGHRVPTLKSELADVMSKYKGHVIATSACIGGELSSCALLMSMAESENDMETARYYYQRINDFVKFCMDTFGEDFYVECAPATSTEQKIVNAKLYKIAKAFNLKMVIGTDAHYLRPKNRFAHKVYLQSKEGDREVDSFYEFTYLMTSDEVRGFLKESIPEEAIDWIFQNTLDMQETIQEYSLARKQIIPKVEVTDYPALNCESDFTGRYKKEWNFPVLDSLLNSSNIQERYWVNECLKALADKDLYTTEYLQRLETEADVIVCIGEKLDDCLFAYFNTFKHYIDLFWECGSIVGPGRGSATGFLSNYLLGITQLDPVRWGLPYWRFLNKERAELPSLLLILGSCKKSA